MCSESDFTIQSTKLLKDREKKFKEEIIDDFDIAADGTTKKLLIPICRD